jgi:uncharacterized protein
MPVDHIRYDILVQKALREMVRGVLTETVKNGLPGDHHFFITFDTTAEGVQLSSRLRAQYPEEMTIVLQHQYRGLKVSDEAFEVGLSFGGVPERLVVPLDAIKVFADPSVQFTLQFETLAEAPDEALDETAVETQDKTEGKTDKQTGGKRRAPQRQEPGRTSVPASPQPAAPAADEPSGGDDKPGDKGGAEVVRLDRFRKK